MSFWDAFTGGSEPAKPVPAPDQTRQLLLYKYDSCGYCQRVMRAAKELGLDLPTRDIQVESGARQELIKRSGRSTVPCLFVDGVPLFESADIVVWLRKYADRAGADVG